MRPQKLENNHLGEFIKQKLAPEFTSDELARQIKADGISCDGSTIRQIIQGNRVPKFGSPVISAIAEKLGIPLDEMEKYHLQSLKEKEATRQKERSKIDSKELLEPLTELNTKNSSVKAEHSRPSGSIKGCEQLILTKIQILKDLVQKEGLPEENTIFIVFQGEKSIFSEKKEYQNEYQKSLAEVIRQGWNVKHLIRLDSNFRERTYTLASNAFRFFGNQGRYEPRYLNTRRILEPSYGVFLIPGQKALISLSADDEKMADSALYIEDQSSLEIIHKHCKQIENKSKPIFMLNGLHTYQQSDFVQELIKADQESGDRYVISGRLTEITRPLSWYDEDHPWAKALITYLKDSVNQDRNIDFSNHIEIRKKRAEKLLEHLDYGLYNCYYVYPKSMFSEFINTGKTNPYYFTAEKYHIIEQLDTIKSLLTRHNYHLALVDSDVFEKITPTFCEVQGSHLVMMEFLKKKDENINDSKYSSQWYLSKEPIVVRSFQDRLSQIWQSFDANSKDRSSNRIFIEEKIEYIKRQINQHQNSD